ncbi:flavodoxin domain-containing protein [Actinomycetospora sp. C-140]
MKVLVGYATAHGSTREIAEHLAARLAAHGLDVAVRDLPHAGSLDDVDAFVIGSAVHDRHWLREAEAFMTERAPELAAKPLWAFSVGMPDALRFPVSLLGGWQAPALVAGFAGSVSIRDHLALSGVVRDEHLSLLGRLLLRVVARGAGDYRDWDRVDRWADGIARVLRSLPVAPSR